MSDQKKTRGRPRKGDEWTPDKRRDYHREYYQNHRATIQHRETQLRRWKTVVRTLNDDPKMIEYVLEHIDQHYLNKYLDKIDQSSDSAESLGDEQKDKS